MRHKLPFLRGPDREIWPPGLHVPRTNLAWRKPPCVPNHLRLPTWLQGVKGFAVLSGLTTIQWHSILQWQSISTRPHTYTYGCRYPTPSFLPPICDDFFSYLVRLKDGAFMSIIYADCICSAISRFQPRVFNPTVRTLVVILIVIARPELISHGCKQ